MIVIFDLDGTVWDSREGILRTLGHTFDQLGIVAPAVEVMEGHIGPPLQEMLCTLGIPAEQVDRAADLYRDRYVRLGVYEATVYPGITEMIDRLREDGHRLATATSKGEDPTHQMLEHFGIADRFDVIGAASMDGSSSSKSDVLGRALTRLGSPDPGRCVLVGDRSYDVEGAASHGIDCIGVTWGFGSESELIDAGAVCTVDDTSALLTVVGGWPEPQAR